MTIHLTSSGSSPGRAREHALRRAVRSPAPDGDCRLRPRGGRAQIGAACHDGGDDRAVGRGRAAMDLADEAHQPHRTPHADMHGGVHCGGGYFLDISMMPVALRGKKQPARVSNRNDSHKLLMTALAAASKRHNLTMPSTKDLYQMPLCNLSQARHDGPTSKKTLGHGNGNGFAFPATSWAGLGDGRSRKQVGPQCRARHTGLSFDWQNKPGRNAMLRLGEPVPNLPLRGADPLS